MPAIVLATLNAKWIHAAFGLRYLRANLGELRADSAILEFDLQTRPADVVEQILAQSPRIVGLGVYVWNALQTAELVAILKAVAPDVVVVLGGPEVSHETEQQPMCALADYVIRGEADFEFARLCRTLLAGQRAEQRVLDAAPPHFEQLEQPYDEYTDVDIQHRVIYVEASRGCPFTCEFCLSALDVPVRKAPVDAFLQQMQRLLDRGVLNFKFVDRTFNLDIKVAVAILEFFLQRLRPGLFVHFELVPDRLPDALKESIAKFPEGTLQFEVGVQTLDPVVGKAISRRQDNEKLEANLRWLHEHTGVHLHADLIVGLPGEDLATFGRGFDFLHALRPHEIQVGILKRLRGTPIVRHDHEQRMVYSQTPPYEVLQTASLTFPEVQAMKRFARYWDVVANSGNWPATMDHVLAGESAFRAFLQFSDWIHTTARATHGIAMHKLASLLFEWLTEHRGVARDTAGKALADDYARGRRHDWPEFLRPWARPRAAHGSDAGIHSGHDDGARGAARQERHRRE
ncbi:MAG: DUF4080 domain-containing protein [Planctomycetota bacterium]